MLSYKWCMCTLVALLFASSSITAAKTVSQTITVDPSGHGHFRTIQSAVDSVPHNNQRWIRIDIKPGYYREQVRIPREKPFIFLNGAGMANTYIAWDTKDNIQSPAFDSEADNILAKGITFSNSYNGHNTSTPMARAVAARILGDKSAFFLCGFTSLQDTLWDYGGRHYFRKCAIRGSVDFIFGNGNSIYESCMINVASRNIPGYITAQGRGTPEDRSGFVFSNCRIVGTGKAYLGRPWRPYAKVLFYNTWMSEGVVPQGWLATGDVKLLSMSEVDCHGPGANSRQRVKWEKKMREKEARQLASTSSIDDEGWVRKALDIVYA